MTATPTEEAQPAQPTRARENGVAFALRHADFTFVWVGALVSNIGNWVEIVCQNWLVWKGSQSTTLSGILQAAVTLAGVLMALPMGLVADRVDRGRLFLRLQIALTLLAALQAVAAHM